MSSTLHPTAPSDVVPFLDAFAEHYSVINSPPLRIALASAARIVKQVIRAGPTWDTDATIGRALRLGVLVSIQPDAPPAGEPAAPASTGVQVTVLLSDDDAPIMVHLDSHASMVAWMTSTMPGLVKQAQDRARDRARRKAIRARNQQAKRATSMTSATLPLDLSSHDPGETSDEATQLRWPEAGDTAATP